MKLLFNPSLSGFAYTNLKAAPGNMLFDCQTIGLTGLLELLQMYSGVNVKVAEPSDRLVEYFSLLRRYVKAHRDCVLARSFEVDGLNTAKQCLLWRDALRAAGWHFGVKSPSRRLEVLAEIERDFKLPGTADLLLALTDAIEKGCAIPANLEIVLPCDISFLMPAVGKLLKVLESRGVRLGVAAAAKQIDGSNLQKVTRWLLEDETSMPVLNDDDDSLRVLEFDSRDESLAYLTGLDASEFDVWVNSDNKLMDNWLTVQGLPTSGSEVNSTLPQTLQLLVIGLGLFARPLNIKNLVEWLNTSENPLGRGFRSKLSAAIVSQNGFFNESCDKIIRDYIAEKEGNAEKVKAFLPSDSESVSTQDMLLFVNKFTSWARQRANLVEEELLKIQLFQVAKEAASIGRLLETFAGEEVSFSNVQDWIHVISGYMSYPQYQAQVCCRTVVNNAANIVSVADKVICCDFYGESLTRSSYSFLTNVELAALKKCEGLNLWESEKETLFNQAMQWQLFTRTSGKLNLVVVKYIGPVETTKHPLMIRLENVLKTLTKHVSVSMDSDLPCVNNRMDAADDHVTIEHPELLAWKNSQSYSALDVLINNPFDYVFSNMAHIDPLGLASVAEVFNVKGTVAHAVIEQLFTGEPKEFDAVVEQQIKECGSILLLEENCLEMQSFKNELRDVVGKLRSLIEENGLKVESCEDELNEEIGLGSTPVHGFVDMILSDKDGNLHIWDFKWSSAKKYTQLIEQNKSIQLSLYSSMVSLAREKQVKGVAYYVMPACKLITADEYVGDDVHKVSPVDDADLIEKIKTSYDYRRRQISSGIIEIADGMPVTDIPYGRDAALENLVPLNADENGLKQGNKYSKNTIFKGKKSV